MNVVKYVTQEPLNLLYVQGARWNDQLIGHLSINYVIFWGIYLWMAHKNISWTYFDNCIYSHSNFIAA
jgi:hypothetical protein